jgi:glycosyltransferase involved in cell wall biosynthesis
LAYGDLVSCLCVTRNRVALLRRAVQCFLRQTYSQKELIVLYESDDIATRYFVAQLNEPSILAIEVSATPRLTLGSLRNLAVRVSRGNYVAQWDDDDWHGPARIEEQMSALETHGRPGCVLLRWLLYDEVTHKAMVSHTRAWEGSLLARRDAMPLYADLPKFEDTPAVTSMLNEDKLVGLDRPDLYVYTYHGANTWERSHWDQQIALFATPLNDEDTEQVRNALYGAA